jgi:Zn-dependent protease/CBS domain-containing protein
VTPPERRATLRIAGIAVHVPFTGVLGVALLAYLWVPTFERAGTVSPGGMAIVFAVLLSMATLAHEFAHALSARRLGYQVEAIHLHFLGGVTIFQRRKDSPWSEAAIAAAGPLTTLLIAAFSGGVASVAASGTTLGMLATAMAWANLLIGLFNSLPGLPLDGGNVVRCVTWALTGSQRKGTVAAAWGGRALALLIMTLPVLLITRGSKLDLVSIAICALLASMLWNGAGAHLQAARVRESAQGLTAAGLARRALPVSHDLPLSEALRRAALDASGALVVVNAAGATLGICSLGAINAVPEQRRPWVPVSAVARPIAQESVLPGHLEGAGLLAEISARNAEEFLVLDPEGRVFGVLATSDLDSALRTGRRGRA